MAKPNSFIMRMQAAQAIEMERARLFTIQQCKDMMLIAANEAFGFGAERLKRLSDAYDATFMEYANMTLSDAKEDKQLWFTKGKVDQQLEKICGEYFIPWEERYGR